MSLCLGGNAHMLLWVLDKGSLWDSVLLLLYLLWFELRFSGLMVSALIE